MSAPADTTPVAFTFEEVNSWNEWLQAHEGQFLRMFRAIEWLADEATVGMRLALHPNDERGMRYDEIEEHRNEALKMLSWISGAERQIAESFAEKLLKTRTAGAK